MKNTDGVRAKARRVPGTVWRNVALPLDVFKRLDEVAAKAGRSTAHELRLAIEAWLDAVAAIGEPKELKGGGATDAR